MFAVGAAPEGTVLQIRGKVAGELPRQCSSGQA
jgi:hypothetical protein